MQLANGVRDQSGQSGPSGRPAPAELAAAAKRAQARPQVGLWALGLLTSVGPVLFPVCLLIRPCLQARRLPLALL